MTPQREKYLDGSAFTAANRWSIANWHYRSVSALQLQAIQSVAAPTGRPVDERMHMEGASRPAAAVTSVWELNGFQDVEERRMVGRVGR
jgi:D-alanyl-D-alanine dipeptidase